MQTDLVRLNVGGTLFTTTRSNLTQYEVSYLGRLLSSGDAGWNITNCSKDEHGNLFIDRDPQLFSYVLDFLRNCEKWVPPSDHHICTRLLHEFQFFNLPTQLLELAMNPPPPAPKNLPPSSRIYAVASTVSPEYLRLRPYPHVLVYDTANKSLGHAHKLPPPFQALLGSCVQLVQPHLFILGGAEYSQDWSRSTDVYGNLMFSRMSKAATTYDITNGNFHQIPDMMTARCFFATATVDDKVLAISGEEKRTLVNTAGLVEVLDTQQGIWWAAPVLGSCLHFLSAAVHEKTVYVSGGFDGTHCRQQFQHYDLRQKKWCRLPEMPDRRCNHASCVVGDRMYVVGGSSTRPYASQLDDLHDGWPVCVPALVYDIRGGKWADALPLRLQHMEGLATARLGPEWVVLGSRSVGQDFENNRVIQVYDRCSALVLEGELPQSSHWQFQSSLPFPVMHMSAAAFVKT